MAACDGTQFQWQLKGFVDESGIMMYNADMNIAGLATSYISV